MLDIQKDIQKHFYPMSERVGACMEVLSNVHKKGKTRCLVLTVSVNKPHTIQLYVVKVQDGGDLSNIPICSTKNLKKLDCRDSKMQPTYEIQLTTDHKTWNFRATKLEAKGEFITAFCRIVGSLQPHLFRDIQLVNLPTNLDLSTLDQHHSLESLLSPSEGCKVEETSIATLVAAGAPGATESYRSLTLREEEDIRQFLDELSVDSVQRNATELTEHLQKQLADVEGTNIHTIMASEAQVMKLMSTLDVAIEQADKMVQRMAEYHQFLADVEEAMSTLHDRDQLSQVTVDNRGALLNLLEQLVTRLTLDPKYVHALLEVKLDQPADIIRCTEAAQYLNGLLHAKPTPGEEHLQAVGEQAVELKRLRDSFATELAKKVNNSVIAFSRQLNFVVNVGSVGVAAVEAPDSASQTGGSRATLTTSTAIRNATELYKAQREELIQLVPLVGVWLQTNRKDIYTELKREYAKQMYQFFRHQTLDLFHRGMQSISTVVRPQKSTTWNTQRTLETAVAVADAGSLLLVQSPEASVLNQVTEIVDDLLTKLCQLVDTEEQFITQFFDMQQKTSAPSVYKTLDDVGSVTAIMSNLFRDLESDTANFITGCEQVLPILVMPLLVAFSRHTESDIQASSSSAEKTVSPREPTWFSSQYMVRMVMTSKRAFNRHIERMIQSFKESKPSKRSRCGVLQIVRDYVEFAERSISVFSRSTRLVDLERAHGELVRTMMTQLEQIASQSVKTPREVVQLENYHRLNDIFRRLKLAGMEEYRQEAKSRYARALQEYTKNSMGRPLEKLATFFEGVNAALAAGVRPEVIQYQFAFSKQELQKVIREYPGREVKRGLENLCKKVEKHLSEEGNLFQVRLRVDMLCYHLNVCAYSFSPTY
ncbi:Exocyst complex component 1, variant 2 [Clonorchis sinensis]|uniref:Exocyst complex component 1, variant 2 n=1 Tax=Clonorchis sinensis TaxID=79923 RepID=A0A8T1M840_CLOSI|nr:Exocyst complex component 1, variant 2 [Clonorchis sinensis]